MNTGELDSVREFLESSEQRSETTNVWSTYSFTGNHFLSGLFEDLYILWWDVVTDSSWTEMRRGTAESNLVRSLLIHLPY
mgnify:CR=1 FL=1